MIALNFKEPVAFSTGSRLPAILKNRVLPFTVYIASILLFTQSAAAQAPNISYSPSTNVLTVGSAFSITPGNIGGAVPLNTLGLISTFAGSTAGTSGRTNAIGTAALFSGPWGGAFDASGNVYVVDNGNNEIRKITPAGVVTLLAGSPTGASGITNGTGTAALFKYPVGIASDGAGNLYVTDESNNEIRKIVISTGAVTLLAGSASGAFGSADGTGTAATFNEPEGITYNAANGALYVTEGNGNRIRKVTTAGVVTTFAGSGTSGKTNGTGTAAQFFAPRGIAADASGNLYVADYGNNEIRKITTAGVVSLFAGSATGATGTADGTGSAATFSSPLSVTVNGSGNLYVGDGSNLIRSITSAGVVTTVAGTGSIGYVDGSGTVAKFDRIEGIEYNPTNGTVLIGDLFNNAVREMSNYGYFISPSLPAGLSFDGTTGKISGTLTASFSSTVFTVVAYNQYGSSSTTITLSTGQPPNISYSPSTNTLAVGNSFTITPANTGGAVPAAIYDNVTTFAGSTSGTSGLTNGTGTAALFNGPWGITSDPSSGTLYVADEKNNEIRQITSAGVVSLLAGSSTGASGNTDGTGTAALLLSPAGITTDGAGNLYVAEASTVITSPTSNNDIRKIVVSTGAVTRIAGSGNGTTYGTTNGTGTAATFNVPSGITYNSADGNFYITDYYGNDVRKMTPATVVSLFAGSPTQASGLTNGTGSAALFNNPQMMAVDPAGNLYVCDRTNNQIRKITPAGVVTLFAGSPTGAAGYADGTGSAAKFNEPWGAVCDASGNLYVMDPGNHRIRFITTTGVVTTVFGNGTAGLLDGSGTASEFYSPLDAAFDPTKANLYVTDFVNNDIRKISLCGYTISPSLPAGLSFDGTTGTINGIPATTFAATTFTVTAYNQYGNSSTPITLSCVGYDWTGTTSTDWATGSNWSSGIVPTSTNAARIGVIAYTGSQPTLSSSTSVYSVEFGKNTAAILTIASGATLTGATNGIVVDASASPTIKGPGTIAIGSACASTIPATASLTLAANAILALGTNASLTNSGTLTLGSDANGSASIAALPSGASVSGIVNVQRYITGGSNAYRGYRLLSSPVNASSNTSGGGSFSFAYINTTVGSNNGAFTGGPGGIANGFTFSNTNPTIYIYNEAAATNNTTFITGKNIGVTAITGSTVSLSNGATNQSIPVGNGYLMYFIGDNSRTTAASSVLPQNTTITATGTLNQGTIPVTIWSNSSTSLSYTPAAATTTPGGATLPGLNQVGNPYASTISLDQLWADNNPTGSASGISSFFYELQEPGQAYIAYDASSSHRSSSSNAGPYIVSGQGFITAAQGPGQTITFKEDQKVNTQLTSSTTPALLLALKTKNLALAPTPATAPAGLHLQLSKDSLTFIQTGIYFSSAWSDKYTNDDATYLGGFSTLNLASLSSDGTQLGINSMGDYIAGKRIRLFISASASQSYKLNMVDIKNIDTIYNVMLVDNLLKDSVDLRTKAYTFNINMADTTTFGANRFVLAVELKALPPYKLLTFTGKKASTGIQLAWTTANEGNYTGFTLEKLSGTTFVPLTSMQGNGSGAYAATDSKPDDGVNTYRLAQNDAAGKTTYSQVVTINPNSSAPNDAFSVYPNPAHANINIIVNLSADVYKLTIFNSFGRIMKNASLSSGTNWTEDVSQYIPGNYVVEMYDSKGHFVGKSKFIKLQ